MKKYFINDQIRDNTVRLIGADGKQLGVVPLHRAKNEAEKAGLDLVKVSPPNVKPAVCKLLNYDKFAYEQEKHVKEIKKANKVIDFKEIRLSTRIDVHDFETRVRNAEKFLIKGHPIKVSVKFRGREILHPEQGKEVLERFIDAMEMFGTVEKEPRMEGKFMSVWIKPIAAASNKDKKNKDRE